jgi:hypothetical protein
MKIVWDETKRLSNIEVHGLDFADATEFDWLSAIVLPSHANRYRAIGLLSEKLVVALIFKPLGTEAISIISLRPASKSERKMYGER